MMAAVTTREYHECKWMEWNVRFINVSSANTPTYRVDVYKLGILRACIVMNADGIVSSVDRYDDSEDLTCSITAKNEVLSSSPLPSMSDFIQLLDVEANIKTENIYKLGKYYGVYDFRQRIDDPRGSYMKHIEDVMMSYKP